MDRKGYGGTGSESSCSVHLINIRKVQGRRLLVTFEIAIYYPQDNLNETRTMMANSTRPPDRTHWTNKLLSG